MDNCISLQTFTLVILILITSLTAKNMVMTSYKLGNIILYWPTRRYFFNLYISHLDLSKVLKIPLLAVGEPEATQRNGQLHTAYRDITPIIEVFE